MMGTADTWLPLYVGDYLGDTMNLRTLEHGAYLLLLMHYWREGPLPNNEIALASITKVSPRFFGANLASVLLPYFALSEDGLLHQKRMDIERANAIALSEKRRSAAHKRWEKADAKAPNGHAKHQANGHENSEQMQMQGIADSRASALPSPSPSSLRSDSPAALRASPPPRRAGSALEKTWKPDEAGEALARQRGVLDLDREIASFRDFYTSRGAEMADWQAAWRRWCDKAPGFARPAQRFSTGPRGAMEVLGTDRRAGPDPPALEHEENGDE